ncbi:unnamed protein product [Mytilus coruscus]|uniref:Uncharacterized protein n=1 Tax=Mytilus coruscus TaxID=42192 RepID=A0A6J8DAC9_MYTCO|nr:unnamed protein product [Mytilus coruscus]
MASRSGDADNAAMFVGYFDVEDSNNVDSCQQEIVTLEPLASSSQAARGSTVEASRGSDSNSCAIPQCSANDLKNVNKDGSAQQTTLVVDDGNSFDAFQLLNEKLSGFSTEEKVGPNVSDNLGMFVNSILTTQMNLTKRNEFFHKYLRPGNSQLNFPTVNDVIYEQCIGSFGRSNDVKLHTIQRVLLKGLTPLVILVNKLASGTEVPDKKELSQTMLDSIALLATS